MIENDGLCDRKDKMKHRVTLTVGNNTVKRWDFSFEEIPSSEICETIMDFCRTRFVDQARFSAKVLIDDREGGNVFSKYGKRKSDDLIVLDLFRIGRKSCLRYI